jgi:hypothetical protein
MATIMTTETWVDRIGNLIPRTRPLARDIEWNRIIHDMPVRTYIAWRLAGRPGFSDMAPHKIREWLRGYDDDQA